MGRKTMESLGKPLPGRTNVMITAHPSLHTLPDVTMFTGLTPALEWLEAKELDKVYVIGGGQLFREAIAVADEMVLTRVHTVIGDADAFFPEFDHTHWKLVWEEAHHADERHDYDFTFQHYKRVEL